MFHCKDCLADINDTLPTTAPQFHQNVPSTSPITTTTRKSAIKRIKTTFSEINSVAHRSNVGNERDEKLEKEGK